MALSHRCSITDGMIDDILTLWPETEESLSVAPGVPSHRQNIQKTQWPQHKYQYMQVCSDDISGTKRINSLLNSHLHSCEQCFFVKPTMLENSWGNANIWRKHHTTRSKDWLITYFSSPLVWPETNEKLETRLTAHWYTGKTWRDIQKKSLFSPNWERK